MKKSTKWIAGVLCAVLLVAASVAGTMAYLTGSDEVQNTFTVGKLGIVLDEAKVDEYGVPVEDADRVKANTYKLVPGYTYVKDPTVWLQPQSEACYLFVEVENGLEGLGVDLEPQILANGWTQLENEAGVYYRLAPATGEETAEYPVFADFTLSEELGKGELADAEEAAIQINAYAVQQKGFENAADAWSTFDS